ncbi:Uncharacterized protein ALO43_00874 [Pseudomonas tremae]|uniref:Uncharacterized protein n=4 Tax=Pseudomonas syringae group TaxID=136849 RepID=A0AB37QL79_9PSED|nr:hypothetical protein OA77_08580 [Pseudomonas coronafaciens]KOP54482.1 hypothetical protein OX88_17570 [Pseudomonas coronafaciens pv. porri]KPB51473.1 Uncharacterized protein AC511_1631 [Pseudomonas coronafaciens pv. oryzae]KPW32749.1 Uncharacterized protein ALO66_02493 [Pseudomonas coronafaciens pv. atropurpurea]KPX34364.1 Uncharacterized protein ALO77_02017 [Pseudomonas coronafaciens pv. garcae]KPY92755.1 Uncharacterized protein ALO43_00874 [Pseudomonas tremae]KPZ23527.1 Uncharacterized p
MRMNDPKQALNKIEDLLNAARGTDDLFHRAAAFSAISILVENLGNHLKKYAPYAAENIESLRSHASSMLGYDVTIGHSTEQHHLWALAAIAALNEALDKLSR